MTLAVFRELADLGERVGEREQYHDAMAADRETPSRMA